MDLRQKYRLLFSLSILAIILGTIYLATTDHVKEPIRRNASVWIDSSKFVQPELKDIQNRAKIKELNSVIADLLKLLNKRDAQIEAKQARIDSLEEILEPALFLFNLKKRR